MPELTGPTSAARMECVDVAVGAAAAAAALRDDDDDDGPVTGAGAPRATWRSPAPPRGAPEPAPAARPGGGSSGGDVHAVVEDETDGAAPPVSRAASLASRG